MPIRVTPLVEKDIDGAVTTIQLAFAEDPYNHWVYDDRSKVDLKRNQVSLGIRCHWGIRNALFYVAKEAGSDEVLGMAMWMRPIPSDKVPTWGEWAWEKFESWRLWGNQVKMNLWYGRGGLNVKRYYIWKKCQAAAQQELWTDPRGYYFLNVITVLPAKQGQGIGRALFHEIFKKADAEGISCYLESSRDEPNTKIYNAMGFRVVKEMNCDDDGVNKEPSDVFPRPAACYVLSKHAVHAVLLIVVAARRPNGQPGPDHSDHLKSMLRRGTKSKLGTSE